MRPMVCSRGTVYSSAMITTLFFPKEEDTQIANFVNHLNNEFKQLVPKFQDIIIKQNQFEEDQWSKQQDEGTNKQLKDDSKQQIENIKSFFYTDYTSTFTYFSKYTELPNLFSIYIPPKYWNVNVVAVNEKEYEGVKVYKYQEKSSKESLPELSKSKYGPKKGEINLYKFMKDFSNCLQEQLRLMKQSDELNWDFSITKYSQETEEAFKDVKWGMRKYYTVSNYPACVKLTPMIKRNLETNFKGNQHFIEACYKAASIVFPAWDEVEFYFI